MTHVELVQTEPDFLTVSGLCRALNIGRTSAYQLFEQGEIVPIKLGSRTLIPRAEKDRFVARKIAESRNAQGVA